MSILKISNKENLDTNLHARFISNFTASAISNDILSDVERSTNRFYASNNMVLRLERSDDEISDEEFAEILRARRERSPIEENPAKKFFFGSGLDFPVVKCIALWKTKDLGSFKNIRDYTQFSLNDEKTENLIPVSISDNDRRMELEFSEDLIDEIESFFEESAKKKPGFGLILFSFITYDPKFITSEDIASSIEATGEISSEAASVIKKNNIILKYSHDPIFALPDIFESLTSDDEDDGPKTSFTSPYSYETLFVPTLSCSFVYNFFQSDEESFEAASRKNYIGKPLDEIPKYIRIEWNRAPHTAVATGIDAEIATEEEEPEEDEEAEVVFTETEGEVEAASADESDTSDGTSESSVSSGLYIDGVYYAGGEEDVEGDVMEGADGTSRDASGVFGGPTETTDGGIGDTVEEEDSPIEAASEDAIEGFETVVGAGEFIVKKETEERIADVVATLSKDSRYIGYVIQKERINENEGTSEVIDLKVVPNVDTTQLIDWKIAYGETYRYKIRSVFRFVTKRESSVFGDSSTSLTPSASAAVFDRGVSLSSIYYFDSQFSKPCETQVLEFERPDSPQNFKIFPNSIKKYFLLKWAQKNEDLDISGFNVYRKLPGEPFFQKLNDNLLPIRENYYIDKEVDIENEYIYAIESVDVHFNRSKLSTQLKASLRRQVPDYEIRCENDVVFWEYFGKELFPVEEKKRREVIKFKENFEIVPNPLFINLDQDQTYLIKVTSLDNFKQKEFKLNFNTRIINKRTKVPAESDVLEEARRPAEAPASRETGITRDIGDIFF